MRRIRLVTDVEAEVIAKLVETLYGDGRIKYKELFARFKTYYPTHPVDMQQMVNYVKNQRKLRSGGLNKTEESAQCGKKRARYVEWDSPDDLRTKILKNTHANDTNDICVDQIMKLLTKDEATEMESADVNAATNTTLGPVAMLTSVLKSSSDAATLSPKPTTKPSATVPFVAAVQERPTSTALETHADSTTAHQATIEGTRSKKDDEDHEMQQFDASGRMSTMSDEYEEEADQIVSYSPVSQAATDQDGWVHDGSDDEGDADNAMDVVEYEDCEPQNAKDREQDQHHAAQLKIAQLEKELEASKRTVDHWNQTVAKQNEELSMLRRHREEHLRLLAEADQKNRELHELLPLKVEVQQLKKQLASVRQTHHQEIDSIYQRYREAWGKCQQIMQPSLEWTF